MMLSNASHKRHGLLWAIAGGAFAGFLCGWLLPAAAMKSAFLGELFLLMLRMLVVPLVVASMITGVAGLGDVRRLGRIGAWTLTYYAITTSLALIVGIILVNLIEPGNGIDIAQAGDIPDNIRASRLSGWTDLLLSLFSPNIIAAAAQTDILPLIVFSLAFGAVLSTLGPQGAPVIVFFEGVNAAIMKLVHLVMFYAPIGIFGLVAGRFGEAGGGAGIIALLKGLGLYVITVSLGLMLHAGITLPTILRYFAKRRIIPYLQGMSTALVNAFATASSSATLPLTLEGVEESNHVDAKSARFVLPLGATVNMDGTALYEAVAALFIAQAWGIELGIAQQTVIFLTATLASIGAAGIPEAGTVTMVIVLDSVGLPLEGIGLILAIDWLLDRLRTTVNVWGDAIGAAVVEQITAEQ